MNSSERRMKLILMLQQSTSRLTVDKIAKTFDISRRTVFRDFNALAEMNVPVTHDKYKGYGIMRGYRIPPIMFTTKELATIMVGLNFVKSQVDKNLVMDAEGVELKIKEVLPEDLVAFTESLGKRTVVDPYLNFGIEKKDGGDWYKVSHAIAENKTLRFKYHSKSTGEISSRKVDPYLLVFYSDHWNLIGHSHKRKDYRNFLLDRMTEVEETGENFVPYGQINVEELIFRSEEREQEIVVDVHKQALSRFKANLPSNIIKIKDHKPNFFRTTFKFNNSEYINRWLLQFADKVKVVSPEGLVKKRKELLGKMIENI